MNCFYHSLLENPISIMELISLALGLIGILIGFISYRQNIKSKKFLKDEAIAIHYDIAKALGSIQAVKQKAQAGSSILHSQGEVEGYLQSLLVRSIKLHCTLGDLTFHDIDELGKKDAINKDYLKMYYSFAKKTT